MKQLFFFLVIFSIPFKMFAQDLTGTWEGQLETKDGGKYDITVYLSKVNDNSYSGVSVEKMKKPPKVNIDLNPKNPSINVGDINPFGKKPSVTTRVLVKIINASVELTEISFIEKSDLKTNWQLAQRPITLTYQTSRGEKLVSSTDYNIDLKKKNNEFPSQYSRYSFKEFVSVNSVNFSNSKNSNKISYNDKGTLAFSFTNNSDIDFKRFNLSFSTKEKNIGILGLEENIVSSMTLQKGQTEQGFIDLSTGFNVTPHPVHFTVEGNYNGITLFLKEFTLETIPFYLTEKTTVSNSSSKSLSVVAGYYGFNKTPYTAVENSLNQFVATGNKFAPMWKAIFQTMGWGGFIPNENEALQLAKKSYNDIIDAARNGDAESQYLMFYAVGMGLNGMPNREAAGEFLTKSANAEFLPAMYDYALYLQKDHQYEESFALLNKCYNKGLQKAALNIGYFYRKGLSVTKDIKKALEWYQKGETFGDPANMMHMANLYTEGEDVEPNIQKGISYANKAANLKSSDAIIFLAKIYLNGSNGVQKNISKSLELYKQAANLGDNSAMNSLAYLYLQGNSTVIPKDERIAYFWAKKASEAGGAKSMILLANMYEEGKVVDRNIIKARFWSNQAYLNGVGRKRNLAQETKTQEMHDIWDGMDLRDRIVKYKYDDGSEEIENQGPDYIGELMGSTINIWLERRSKKQAVIDGLEPIYERNGKKIYGGTLTSKFVTEIFLKKGQQLKIHSYGTINLGTFAGISTPDGIGGFQSYSLIPSIPHGSIIGGVNNNWVYIGSENTYTATSNGKFEIGINDADYSNNMDYYDVVIEMQ
jgi:TPR repeat protein